MATGFEIALSSVAAGWALSTLSSSVGSLRRGREAQRAAEAAKLAAAGTSVEAMVNAIHRVDMASRAFEAQRGRRTRAVLGLQAAAELVDGYRQQRPALGIARALGRTLDFDRLDTAASQEFSNGPLQEMTAAHMRLTMTAGGYPELMAAADKAVDAVADLSQLRARSRPAAEQQAAQDVLDGAVREFGATWRRLNEPKRHRFALGRRRGRSSLPASE